METSKSSLAAQRALRLGYIVALAGSSAAVHAADGISIWALLNLGVEKKTDTQAQMMEGYVNILGFTGTKDLGNGLSGNFNLATRFTPRNGQQERPSTFWHQESTAGLKSTTLGALRLGRALTPLGASRYLFEPWGDSEVTASLGAYQVGNRVVNGQFLYQANPQTADFNGYLRIDNAVFYDSPSLAGFEFHGGAQVNKSADPGVTHRAFGVSVLYTNAAFKSMASYEQNTRGAKVWFGAASYPIGSLTLMGSVAQNKVHGAPAQNSVVVAANYAVDAKNSIRIGYGTSRTSGVASDNKVSLGVVHDFGKGVNVYADTWSEENQALTAGKKITGVGAGVQLFF
jgi:predicted porin